MEKMKDRIKEVMKKERGEKGIEKGNQKERKGW